MKPRKPVLVRMPARLARHIAAEADTDPRTVARVVAGLPTWESTRERIQKAMRANAAAKAYGLAGGAK